MSMFSVNVNVDIKTLAKKADTGFNRSQFILDSEILKDSNYYIPKDEGFLEASGITHSRLGEGEINWVAPQAKRLYYNPQFNFSKDKNPNARGLWFEASKSSKLKDWLKQAKKEFESNFK